MRELRTFIAIELAENVRVALEQAQAPLRLSRLGKVVRWVAPTSIHLTLKFLGNVRDTCVGDIEQALDRGCALASPFPISLTHLGCFPNAHRPRVIWIGIGGDVQALQSLQGSIDRELEKQGFARDKRPFSPHLTLGRFRESARLHEKQELVALTSKVHVDSAVYMTVCEVSLICSDLRPTGPIYTPLATIRLSDVPRPEGHR